MRKVTLMTAPSHHEEPIHYAGPDRNLDSILTIKQEIELQRELYQSEKLFSTRLMRLLTKDGFACHLLKEELALQKWVLNKKQPYQAPNDKGEEKSKM